MATPKAPVDPDDAPLKRLGGGRWQTRDERFTIEPQSGTWVVVDAEQTDDFGMPLVRGPFGSLTSAKDAISGARSAAPATSPLAERAARRKDGAGEAKTVSAKPAARASSTSSTTPKESGTSKAASKPADEPPAEPGWLRDLGPADRGRARRLIERLTAAGEDDPEGLVRRDLVGDVPALAARAIARRLTALGDDASPADVADLLADGRDEDLGVRWRLVDGDGRPILLEAQRRRR